MKRGSILLAVVFTITIPAIIAWPALRIAGSWTAGQEAVRSSYGALRRMAINSISLPSAVAAESWTKAARKAWNDDDRLLAIVISDTSGTVLYALPEVSPYYVEPEPGSKGPVYVYPENTVARFNGVIASGLVLDALYVTLRQGELYEPLKDATISLLALLALAAAWLIASSAKNPALETEPDASTVNAEPSNQLAYETPPVPDHLKEFPELMELSSPPVSIGFPAMSDQPEAEDKPDQPDGENKPDQPQAEDHHEEIELVAADDILPVEDSTPEIKTSPLNGPRGLYDPETGLGWESYLRERLGAELRRSASFEQDLSILVASLDSATGRTDPNYAVFAKTSRSFFSFNDLAFIFGTKGLAIILPNTDMDQAMRMSEELLKKLALLIQDRSDPMSYLNLFIGLSSRSGRLVEADRLLGEAMAAHRKAREERDTHIMAFRPDPEKFRAYLANK